MVDRTKWRHDSLGFSLGDYVYLKLDHDNNTKNRQRPFMETKMVVYYVSNVEKGYCVDLVSHDNPTEEMKNIHMNRLTKLPDRLTQGPSQVLC